MAGGHDAKMSAPYAYCRREHTMPLATPARSPYDLLPRR